MRFMMVIVAAGLICACKGNAPCNGDEALRVATAHAKARPGMAYYPDEIASISIEDQNYMVSFSRPGLHIGGGLTVWVDRTTCTITESLLGQ